MVRKRDERAKLEYSATSNNNGDDGSGSDDDDDDNGMLVQLVGTNDETVADVARQAVDLTDDDDGVVEGMAEVEQRKGRRAELTHPIKGRLDFRNIFL